MDISRHTNRKPATKEICFYVRRDEMELIDRIANRALNLAIGLRVQHKKQDFAMDITCVHANGNPLRLARTAGGRRVQLHA